MMNKYRGISVYYLSTLEYNFCINHYCLDLYCAR